MENKSENDNSFQNDISPNRVIYKMSENPNVGYPVYIRKYTIHKQEKHTPIHQHDSIQMNYIWRGSAMHYIRGEEFSVLRGDIFVIPPFMDHALSGGQTDSEVIEVEFMPEFINNSLKSFEDMGSNLDFGYIKPFLEEENEVKPRLNLMGKTQIEIENALNECLLEYTEKRPGYILAMKSLLLKMLITVGREYVDNEVPQSYTVYDRHRDTIMAAVEYMGKHYQENLNIDDIAKQFMLSPSYFSYLFKSITAKTFTEYLNTLRIASTQQMLKTTDKLVLDICYEVGFNNVNHFNRLFKQFVGMSPKQYRKFGQ